MRQTQLSIVFDNGGKNLLSAQMLEVSSLRNRGGAPSRKGYVINGQMTKASCK